MIFLVNDFEVLTEKSLKLTKFEQRVVLQIITCKKCTSESKRLNHVEIHSDIK